MNKLSLKWLCAILILLINFLPAALSQEFRYNDFINVWFKREQYDLKKFEKDTSIQAKKLFLSRLKAFDPNSYKELEGLMEMNGDTFPQSFFITDVDRNGIKEYFITENYEGAFNLCITFKDKKPVRFLRDIAFDDLLVERPDKIWISETDSYIGWERSYDLLAMINKIYGFNMTTMESKYLFKLYESVQIAPENSKLSNAYLERPKTHYPAKGIVLNAPTRIYSNPNLSNAYLNTGILTKNSYGWIIADSLNAFFAIMDSTTGYVNDSLCMEKITPKDRGYLMCWIPKNAADFINRSNLFKDKRTNEYLRISETEKGFNVNYFSGKSFEKNLVIDSFNKEENTLIVHFKTSRDKYGLELGNNQVICTNPDKSKQTFIRIE